MIGRARWQYFSTILFWAEADFKEASSLDRGHFAWLVIICLLESPDGGYFGAITQAMLQVLQEAGDCNQGCDDSSALLTYYYDRTTAEALHLITNLVSLPPLSSLFCHTPPSHERPSIPSVTRHLLNPVHSRLSQGCGSLQTGGSFKSAHRTRMKVSSGSVRPGQVLYCAASKLQLRNVLLASRTKAMNHPCESVEYDALCRRGLGSR